MRTLLITLIAAALLPVSAGAGERKPKPPAPSTALPAKELGRARGNPCAAFGPGFVQLEGSSTCVRLGGGIGVGVGTAR